ncbi:hypothetical protein OESDEN_00227 [Oesophagostomum dentatum]|uniref:Mos1 transposase HTH domain-containing protein n=1 Tax=Oesophagostomum dentatum TaxID=61180 RepID=A0A0B1TV81_OESDE|nr:hypothetical protein OESDEN_00227 [Oesophagostomum dentatum]
MRSEHLLRTVIYYERRNPWFNRLVSGDTSFEGNERPERASTVSEGELLHCIKANPEATTRELAAAIGCCQRIVITHLHNLGCCRVMARWIRHQPNDTHRQVRVNICESLFFHPNRNEFLEDLVGGDGSWILYDNNARYAVWLPGDADTLTQPKSDLQSPSILFPFGGIRKDRYTMQAER